MHTGLRIAALAVCAMVFGPAHALQPCAAPALSVSSQGSLLCVLFTGAGSPQREQMLRVWIERSAGIVAAYYGKFPADRVALTVRSGGSTGVSGGRTINEPPLHIQVTVGQETTAADLSADWVLVHEMIHLALPELGRRHDWLAEGLATYVEGIARAQAGNRAVSDVWAEYRRSMPRGLAQPGEGGMDQTPTWGRTYWGGALFCLQADIAIREQTGNRLGLQTALRAILDRSGGYASERGIDEVLQIGDAATGTHVLEQLYLAVKDTPSNPNLASLWERLGIPADPATQPFDDRAPLAGVRLAITRKP